MATKVPPLSPLPLHDSSNSAEHHGSKKNPKNHQATKKGHHKKHSHQSHKKHHSHHAHHGHHKSPKTTHATPAAPAAVRRLSASFQPVSWSDFAAVETRLTQEALQYVNDPKRLEELRKESLASVKRHLTSESIWTLEEDRELLRGRGFNVQEEYDKILKRIQNLPTRKYRTIESLKRREMMLLGESGCGEGGDENSGDEQAHMEYRGKLVMQDLMTEFLGKGTGVALSMGVREDNIMGEPLSLKRHHQQQQGKEEEKEKEKEQEDGFRSPSRPSTTKKIQEMTRPPPMLPKDMNIRVKSSLGGSGVLIPCSIETMRKTSPMMRACLDGNKPAIRRLLDSHDISKKLSEKDSTMTYDSNKKEMIMSDGSPELVDVHTHGMVSKEIIERFVKYSVDPKMMERADHLRGTRQRRREHAEKLRKRGREQMMLERMKTKTEIRNHQEQENEELREYLEDQMKAEIDAVVARHEQIKVAENQHLNHRHAEQTSIVDMFYDEQDRIIHTMGEPPSETPAVRLAREQQMEHSEESIRGVFSGSDVVILMLLGSYLHCNDLVAGCLRSMSKYPPEAEWLPEESSSSAVVATAAAAVAPPINKRAPPIIDYMEGPGRLYECFDSQLVDDSMMMALTQRLPTRGLMALEAKNGGSVRLMTRVRRELKSRKTMARDDYQKLTHEQLRYLNNQSEYFVKELKKNNGTFYQDELFGGSGGSGGGSSGSGSGVETDAGDHFVLRDVSSGSIVCDWHTPPFVDLVQEEIQRRRKMSTVCFNPDTLPDTLR